MSLKSIFKPVARLFTKIEILDLQSKLEAAEAGFIATPVASRGAWSVLNNLQPVDKQTADAIVDQTKKRINELKATL